MRWLGGSLGLRASSPLPPLARFPFPQGGRLIVGSCFAVAGIGGEVVGSLFMKASLPSLSLRDISPPRERLFFICRFCLCLLFPRGTALALVLFECLAYNRHKESTHSIVWMPRIGLSVFMDTAYSVGRQSRLFYFAQFFL